MNILEFLFHRGNDLTTQFLPDALFFKTSILSEKFPFWNPWIFAGMPYLLDPQNFLWYPPNYLLLLFNSVELGFLVLLTGHLVFAGYFIKKILERFPLWIQIFGAFLFIASPKLISHLEEGNWTLLIAATWLPALYWALVNKRFWWIVMSLSALIINNLNIGYYSVLFALSFFFICRKRSDPAMAGSDLIKILVFTLILSFLRWFPLVLWGDQTVRANLSELPLPLWSWTKITKSLFIPIEFGHPQLQNEEILYVGIIPILLLVWKGLSLRRQGQSLRNALKRFWMIWLVFVFLVTLNVKTPFFSLIKLLPGFSLLRLTTRSWIFVALFAALTVPAVIFQLSKKSKLLAIFLMIEIIGEFGIFGYRLFARRVIPQDSLPSRFYEEMTKEGTPVRAYCTTGCIDRLTAQQMGIALLHGNNPIQLKEFVQYLQDAAGYHESSYFPILPPYTVFFEKPQPRADVLGKTTTKFVVSPYELTDRDFELIDQEQEYRLYRNNSDIMPFSAHHFSLSVSK